MNKGWIKIHRSIIDTADFYDEPLCKMACWTDLIMMAEIEPQIRKSKCGDLFINRGEVAISIGKLAERWNHSIRHCRTIIGWLIKTERIQVRTDKQLTIIKIINYDKYQCTTTTDNVSDKVTDKVSDKVTDKVSDKVDFDVTTNDSTNYNENKLDTDKVSDKVSDKVTDKVSDNIIKNNKEYIKNNIKKISTNVDIKESRNQNEIDFEKLCELWNQQMIENSCTIPQIQRITDRRKQAVLSRLREFSKDDILKVIENCARSDFLNGRNNRNFIASFDWAFLPNNFIKILEGNYNNKFENNPSYQNGLQANTDKYFLRRGIEPKDYDEKDYHTTF